MVWPTARKSCRWESAASIVPSTAGEDQWDGRMNCQRKYEVPKEEGLKLEGAMPGVR